jgi:hypothetical protein
MCMLCRLLLVLLYFWPFYCLSFPLRILITSLWYLQTILYIKYVLGLFYPLSSDLITCYIITYVREITFENQRTYEIVRYWTPQWKVAGSSRILMTRYRLLFSPYTPVHSTNKTHTHDITEILLKVMLNTIILTIFFYRMSMQDFCVTKKSIEHVERP